MAPISSWRGYLLLRFSASFGLFTACEFGTELISDLGVGQSIVYNENAEDPDFYNTAWTLQIIRGIILWAAFLGAAIPIAHLYQSNIFLYIIPVSAFSLVLTGLTSIGKPLLQKRLQLAKLNAFDTIMALLSSAITVLSAYISPTIWGLVFGGLLGAIPSTVGSYFLLHDIKQRFFSQRNFSGRFCISESGSSLAQSCFSFIVHRSPLSARDGAARTCRRLWNCALNFGPF